MDTTKRDRFLELVENASPEQMAEPWFARLEAEAWRLADADGVCEHPQRSYHEDPNTPEDGGSPNGWRVFCADCGDLGQLGAANAEAADGPRAAALVRQLRGLQNLGESQKRLAYRWWTGRRVDACELIDVLGLTLGQAERLPAALWCPGAVVHERDERFVSAVELAQRRAEYAPRKFPGQPERVEELRAEHRRQVELVHAELEREGWLLDAEPEPSDAELSAIERGGLRTLTA